MSSKKFKPNVGGVNSKYFWLKFFHNKVLKETASGFNSLNKKTNNLEICGWVTKDELINKSSFYKKGDVRNRDNGTCFKMKADTYEIENRLLNKINLLL